ncbi:MAG: outer membrane protein assembly factor BamD [Cyclobacteriaceae bacterium]|nr:outer membrane protein assembly factor BamD [Cyclobacteriaceae bacterium]
MSLNRIFAPLFMPGKLFTLCGVLALVLLSGACGNFRKIQKSEDWRIKYDAGLNYYNKKDYYHTAILFEEILPVVRGLPEGEKVEFYLAYCQYYEKTYLLASNQFKTFFETYGRSTLAQEAYFMYAYSQFVSSPDSNLDQKSSLEAMAAMQNFLNRFPNSTFREKAIEVINASQQKLEAKGFENARQYLKIKMYKAAVIAFDNFKKAYPDSKYLEEIAYLKIVSQYRYALASFQHLQTERYTNVVNYYQEFVDAYPNSSFLKDAEKMYSESQAQLSKLKSIKPNKPS